MMVRGGDYIPPDKPSRYANWWCPVCGRPRQLSRKQLERYIKNNAVCKSCTMRYREEKKNYEGP